MVHTNGLRKINPELPFRLFVSIWGGQELSQKWRGVDSYAKALQAASDDPRAIINYTVNAQNIEDIHTVVRDCAELGLTITFQVYSPTSDYNSYLSEGLSTNHKFIRSDNPEGNLVMTHSDDKRAADVICEAIDEYPDTVIFTKALTRWTFNRPGVFFDTVISDNGPTECLAANDPNHRHIEYSGQQETKKHVAMAQ
ncbi:hypothetical protein [Amphritea japonica]|uniref:Uncharacterized protein n=1 Tax=Amphritea japonica ATCC BAA-1530 TaxID=1278309 RepID=A0A7R6SRA7_9GAMM|nr:hypothetical protein [Amphritea japonica]BBB24940.1 hypothetical protein AMJAP_0341 [Amphritea japonica ATCC BAA-1530]